MPQNNLTEQIAQLLGVEFPPPLELKGCTYG
jgi:hypothetical protein